MLAVAAVTLAGCGSSAPTPAPPAREGDVIKRDIGGKHFRTPATATVVRVEHTDPYRWTAELSFTGSTTTVVRDLATNLEEIGFRFSPPAGGDELLCPDGGVIRRDGTGECKINGDIPGGDGTVSVTVARAAAGAPGTVTIRRLFDHRTRGDGVGPPYPAGE